MPIVQATGVAVGTVKLNDSASTSRAEALSKAMTEALVKAHEEGVVDPTELSRRMTAAQEGI